MQTHFQLAQSAKTKEEAFKWHGAARALQQVSALHNIQRGQDPGAVPSSPDLWPCKANSMIPTLRKKNTSSSSHLAFARVAQGPFGVSLWLFYIL